MRFPITIAFVSVVSLVAACGSSDEETVDDEGCEHLTQGPYTQVGAGVEKLATAPAVAADYYAYSISLPAGVPGYVTFQADAAVDHVFFLDQSLPLKVYTSSGTEEPIASSATQSDACPEIKGRHDVALTVGTHILELGPSSVSLVNLVIEEEGGDHAD